MPMNPFTFIDLSAEHRRQLLHDAEQHRLVAAAPRTLRVRRCWVTVLVACPYETTAVNLPVRAGSKRYALELEPVLLPTPSGPHEPDSVRVKANWRARSRRVRAAEVEVRAAGPTWTFLTVCLLAPRRGSRPRVESAAWALAGAVRDEIEARVPRHKVPFSALVTTPPPGHTLVSTTVS
jgi:hypothetical protein